METGYLWIREAQWTTVTVLSPGGHFDCYLDIELRKFSGNI